ncbi:class I SAM-dependent methyltransferase [Qipengyuania sp. CAU 1752]
MALSDPRDPQSLSYRLRAKRDEFLREFLLRNGRRILDMGGTAHYWRRVGLEFLDRHGFEITIVNLTPTDLGEGPFAMAVGDATNMDFADNSFDIVHSNSVIEHVGGSDMVAAFARETRRLAPAYYLQTPNFWFPVDPHFWRMPAFHWMPETLRVSLLRKLPIATAGRLKTLDEAREAVENTRLLTPRQIHELFPDAHVRFERFAGLSKSIIAYRDRKA